MRHAVTTELTVAAADDTAAPRAVRRDYQDMSQIIFLPSEDEVLVQEVQKSVVYKYVH